MLTLAKPSASQLTRMQELTSAWIFRRALNDNIHYKNVDELINDDKFKEEIIGNKTKKGIYPFVDKDREWLETFLKQQQRFLKEFSNAKFKEFSVEGGFMDWVSKLVNQKYHIAKKDAWDPADVWCVQNEAEVKKQITNAINESLNIEVLNSELRTLFKERKVVGISLKKVSLKVADARYQEVNIKEGVLFSSGKHPIFKVNEIRCDLKLLPNGTIKANDSKIYFIVEYTKEKLNYTLTIRTSGRTYRPGNQIFEFQEPGAAAQIGKAPVDLVENAAQRHKHMNFDNEWKNYPTTMLEFNTQEKEWCGIFNKIKNKVKTNINSEEEFVKTMTTLLMDKENYGTANSKLMQLNFLYNLIDLGEVEMEKFVTDLFFLAEKRGPGFGPFGKIY
jgi:hypothetical protein